MPEQLPGTSLFNDPEFWFSLLDPPKDYGPPVVIAAPVEWLTLAEVEARYGSSAPAEQTPVVDSQ